MTAGVQPTLNSINQAAGQIAVNIRNDFQDAVNLNSYINAQGGATFLESLGMSSGDATGVVATYGNLVALNNIYQGTGTQATTFNYEANSELLWGGE
jgi:hypothetical protein